MTWHFRAEGPMINHDHDIAVRILQEIRGRWPREFEKTHPGAKTSFRSLGVGLAGSRHDDSR